MGSHEAPPGIGDLLVPAINRLQDVFAQVSCPGQFVFAATTGRGIRISSVYRWTFWDESPPSGAKIVRNPGNRPPAASRRAPPPPPRASLSLLHTPSRDTIGTSSLRLRTVFLLTLTTISSVRVMMRPRRAARAGATRNNAGTSQTLLRSSLRAAGAARLCPGPPPGCCRRFPVGGEVLGARGARRPRLPATRPGHLHPPPPRPPARQDAPQVSNASPPPRGSPPTLPWSPDLVFPGGEARAGRSGCWKRR